MLRIITEQRGHTVHLGLHGTVAGEAIAVLDEHWRGIMKKAPAAFVKVDLSNVVFIDAHGERLLRRMAQCGVEFEAAGCMNRYVLDRMTGGL
jgi:deoxyadenosine/deoxycytidine kinase